MSSLKKMKNEKRLLKLSQVLSPTLESTQNPPLPDDLLLSCFARVSKLYYPTLSLVSNSFRSLLSLPELYKTRSELKRIERCIYVCLQLPSEPNPRWFTLCRKPNQTLTSGYVLAPVSIPYSPLANSECVAAVTGSDIYTIGGPPSSSVSILDCKSHTWREAPNMRMGRENPAVRFYNRKIYVVGGYNDTTNCSNQMEVFDPKKPMLFSPYKNPIWKRIVIDGDSFCLEHKGEAYVLKKTRWEVNGRITSLDFGVRFNTCCVIDSVIYRYSFPNIIKWYDSKVHNWKILKGLAGLPSCPYFDCVRLVDYCGKMAVLWDDDLHGSGDKEKMIWCAEISLERRRNEVDEIWGKVEWVDGVLKVPSSYKLLKVVPVTL